LRHACPILSEPLDLGLSRTFRAAHDLTGSLKLAFEYAQAENIDQRLVVKFEIKRDFAEYLEVAFDDAVIFRSLDETWLSTSSEHSRWEGDSGTFARVVSGDPLSQLHSFFINVNPTTKHYQFVTDWCCLDVLCPSPPMARIVNKEA
jgi:hypothetical protein